MKKLRQKELRLKDLKDEEVTVHLSESMDDASGFPGIQCQTTSDTGLYEKEESQYPQFQAQDDYGFVVDQSVKDGSCDSGHEIGTGVIARRQVISRHHIGRKENLAENCSFSGTALASKHPARHSNYRDPNPNVCTLSKKNKTWEWKVRAEEQCGKHELDVDDGQGKNSRVLIGSISVAINDASHHSQEYGDPKVDPTPRSKIINDSAAELVVPLSHEKSINDGNITPVVEKHPSTENNFSSCCIADLTGYGHLQCRTFSSEEATAFLSQSKHILWR
jgi:hypothetical protein